MLLVLFLLVLLGFQKIRNFFAAQSIPGVDPSRGEYMAGSIKFGFEMGGGPRVTPVGLSVNGAAPYKEYEDGATYIMRGSMLLSPKDFSSGLRYGTQLFAFGQTDDLNGPLGKIWSIGAGVGTRFSLPMESITLSISPEIAGSLGTFWMKEPAEIGIPGKLYWAADAYQFPQIHGGLSIYIEKSMSELSIVAGIHTGIRWMLHESHVTNLPSEMPKDTIVQLTSPVFEAIQLLFGIHF